ncbi:hypothetical protein [Actinoplanes subtropicus]|uniref:hypothetical protein n=1 Tax=Actinoplanes subtropicus TaxID=543632 RepID=UPI0012FBFD69|nr:hypothetical protein [Actinoplanes subtropicus]
MGGRAGPGGLGECVVGAGARGGGAAAGHQRRGEGILDTVAPPAPVGGPATSVLVEADESDPLAGDWNVTAFAICADPLSGQQVVAASTASGSANDGARADCTGQVATGSGAEIVGVVGEVVIDNAYPIDGSAVSAPTATTVYGQEEDGTTGSWYITAYALCADG